VGDAEGERLGLLQREEIRVIEPNITRACGFSMGEIFEGHHDSGSGFQVPAAKRLGGSDLG
jgi:hypothetical protein